ncbi:MAG: hypothetical protein HY909_21775 [Deltaproteobacteria bacterium]|nr:hypothetical protein [Deltaproteobacteria bacterium]
MRARRAGVFLGLALAAHGLGAGAVPARELVDRARHAAARGDHAAVVRAYEEVRAAGLESDDVLYNLGTAYAHLERYGEAIACFEVVDRRATLALGVSHNLRAARLRLARRDAARTGRAVVDSEPGPWIALGETLPLDASVGLTVLAELLVLAGLWWRRRTEQELARVGATLAVIVAGAVALLGALVATSRLGAPPWAVVLRDGVSLRQTAREDAIPEGRVREGERVERRGREGEFIRVRTLDGRGGWVRSRELGLLPR